MRHARADVCCASLSLVCFGPALCHLVSLSALFCCALSSPLAKGDPVLGISGLDPHSLAFSTPENAPTEIPLGLKKSWKKKKVIKTTPKKSASTAFCAGPLAPKKKSGLSRRKLPGYLGKYLVWPLRPTCQRNITTFQALRTPFRPLVFVGCVSDPGQSSPDVGTLSN